MVPATFAIRHSGQLCVSLEPTILSSRDRFRRATMPVGSRSRRNRGSHLQ